MREREREEAQRKREEREAAEEGLAESGPRGESGPFIIADAKRDVEARRVGDTILLLTSLRRYA